eukprot:TRINITY_DN8472_c0_g1_i1.p1 TRINITY_DN8472_c0_g1~~TRINITY_DN8472_c0_g1_i1.p1  ORF type:complete len:617 (-),score=120.03 TRINITY_DN8472_c0_g1_i1:108-1925(-)
MATVYIAKQDGIKSQLTITSTAIYWKECLQPGRTESCLGSVELVDVAGAREITNLILGITYCDYHSYCFGAESRSAPKQLTFEFDYEDECRAAVKHIICLVRGVPIQPSLPLPTRRLLVFLNGMAGSGSAMSTYQKYCVPIFQAAAVDPHVIETTHAGHVRQIVAREIDSTINVALFDGIVCVGGDGTVHECLLGMMSRPDRDAVRHIPVGQIPVGTANSLACSLRSSDASSAALLIARGATRALDITRVETNLGKTYAFSNVQVGHFANINDGANQNRWLGSFGKPLFGAMWLVAGPDAHRFTITYTLPDNIIAHQDQCTLYNCPQCRAGVVEGRAKLLDLDSAASVVDLNPTPSPHLQQSQRQHQHSQQRFSSKSVTVTTLPTIVVSPPHHGDDHVETPRRGETQTLLGAQSAAAAGGAGSLEDIALSPLPSRTIAEAVAEAAAQANREAAGPAPTVPCEHVSINKQSQNDMAAGTTLRDEGDFVLLSVSKLSHHSAASKFAPFAHSCDGYLDVFTVKSEIGRSQLMEMSSAARYGSHVSQTPFADARKVQNVTVELQKQVSITVDGETVTNVSHLRCSLLPAYWTVFGPSVEKVSGPFRSMA